MTEILHSPPQLPSSPSSITSITPTNNDGFHQQAFIVNNECIIDSDTVDLYRGNCTSTQIHEVEREEQEEEEGLSVLTVLVTIFRKSLVGCKSISGVEVEEHLMDIGCPTNVRHVAHVTFDKFNGFLGLPVEFEPEVPRRPPSASTRVFGVSTESMQLSFDSRGNCVPTILLMMQRRLYSQGGLQSEGIFRINPENGQEEYVREQLNNGLIPDNIDVHCLAGLIKAWFRELPRGILDSLPSEDMMEAQSEDECAHLVRRLPQTEASLLDWAINLMADVAQLERLNKMNARNIAMVFAPNMTQMSDPLTALMYAVQVMNFLKTLIVKTLREREDSVVESGPDKELEPSDENGHHKIPKPTNLDAHESSEDKESQLNQTIYYDSQAESESGEDTHGFLSSIENLLPEEKGSHASDNCHSDIPQGGNIMSKIIRTKTGHIFRSVIDESTEKNKEISVIRRVNSCTERVEAWR